MVQTVSTSDNTEKKNEIISAAQKRFGQYGFKKTSMAEIASDLEMSKGLLYYYFPDKEYLYIAVVDKELQEFKTTLVKHLEVIEHPFDMLKEYLNLRLIHFRHLMNLSQFRFDEMKKLNKAMCQSRDQFKLFERGIIIDILQKGNHKALLRVDDPDEIASLLFDTLRGIRMNMVKDKQFFYLTNAEFDQLKKKYEVFIDIFIAGLQYQAQLTNS